MNNTKVIEGVDVKILDFSVYSTMLTIEHELKAWLDKGYYLVNSYTIGGKLFFVLVLRSKS